jgi:hypothetical protein
MDEPDVNFLNLLIEAEQELLAAEKGVQTSPNEVVRHSREEWLRMCRDKVEKMLTAFTEHDKNSN